MKLTAAIVCYLAAFLYTSNADAQDTKQPPQTVNVPVQCFPGVNLIEEYSKQDTFKPLLYAENEVGFAIFVDPSDGEMHVWAVVGDVPCLIDKTWLKVLNVETLKNKGNDA